MIEPATGDSTDQRQEADENKDLSASVVLHNGLWPTEYVIPRRFCAYRLFDLSNLAPEHRQAALGLQIQKWRASDDSACCIAWCDGRAQVWAAEGSLLPTKTRTFVSESLLIGAVAPEDRAEIVGVIGGFEGRVWRDGALHASRFWDTMPDESEWRFFQRGGGLSVTDIPDAQQLPLQEQGWASAGKNLNLDVLVSERVLVPVALAGLGLLIVWQATQWFLWHSEVNTLDQEYTELSGSVGHVLAARATTQDNLAFVEVYSRYASKPHALSVLASTAGALRTDQVTIVEMEFVGDRLKLVIAGATLALTDYVNSFELQPEFSDVRAQRVNSHVELSMIVMAPS